MVKRFIRTLRRAAFTAGSKTLQEFKGCLQISAGEILAAGLVGPEGAAAAIASNCAARGAKAGVKAIRKPARRAYARGKKKAIAKTARFVARNLPLAKGSRGPQQQIQKALTKNVNFLENQVKRAMPKNIGVPDGVLNPAAWGRARALSEFNEVNNIGLNS